MERKDYLQKNERAKKALNSLLAIVEDIESGMSANEACAKNDMPKAYFRRCCDRILQTLDKSLTRKEYQQIEDVPISWKDNFMQKLYGVSYAPLDDFDEAFKFVCENATDREKMMLQQYYVEQNTIMKIAENNGVTKQAVSVWLKDLNRKLQNENYKLLFIMGNDFTTLYKQRVEHTKAEYARYKANLNILEDSEVSIEDKAVVIGIDKDFTNIYLLNDNGTISNKLFNILKANGIVNLSDLSNYTLKELNDFRGFGTKCKAELDGLLKTYAIKLKK